MLTNDSSFAEFNMALCCTQFPTANKELYYTVLENPPNYARCKLNLKLTSRVRKFIGNIYIQSSVQTRTWESCQLPKI